MEWSVPVVMSPVCMGISVRQLPHFALGGYDADAEQVAEAPDVAVGGAGAFVRRARR